MGWPHFFTVEGVEREVAPQGQDRAVHAVDLFETGPAQGEGKEWVVLADKDGQLSAAPTDALGALPTRVQREILAQRVRLTPRRLEVGAFHLMTVDKVEPQADYAGVNDPLLVYGTLFGPFPSDSPRVVAGALTTTRGDLLEAFLWSAPHAFHWLPDNPYAPPDAVKRVQHAALPADEAETIERGEGVVLGYLLPRSDLVFADDDSGDRPAKELLRDVLRALQLDRAAAGTPLAAMEIPLVGREGVLERLRAQGYEVRGEEARRPRPGFFGLLMHERQKLPRQGDLVEFLRLATIALAAVPGWPDRRARALRARVLFTQVSWEGGVGRGVRPVAVVGEGHFAVRGGELVVFGPAARAADAGAGGRRATGWCGLCLGVDEGFARRSEGALSLDVELFDERKGELVVDFDARGGAWVPARRGFSLQGDGAWRTVSFELDEARLAGTGVQGSSLRLCARGLPELRIRRLGLRAGAQAAGAPPVADRGTIDPAEPPPGWRAPAAPVPTPARGPAPRSAPAARPSPASTVKTDQASDLLARVVFFDPTYPSSRIRSGDRIAARAAAQGFAVLDAAQLGTWMRARIRRGACESVCLMAHDVAPDTVLEEPTRSCTIRRYLDVGGRVVWCGEVPFYYRGHAGHRLKHVAGHEAGGVLGFDAGGSEAASKPVLTPEGKKWGLSLVDKERAVSCVKKSDVTAALTRAGRDRAASWFKSFSPSHPCGGFVRTRPGPFEGSDAESVDELIRLALNGMGAGA